MSVPEYAIPLITAVWRQCELETEKSSPSDEARFGTPPKTLHIYETADADWAHGFCKKPLRGWVYEGGSFSPMSPFVAPGHSEIRNGMYWQVGTVDFCVDLKGRRAIYGYALGPRYARGFRRTFAVGEEICLELDRRFLKWLS